VSLDLILASVKDVISGSVMVLFIISSFLVILVVLAQEGKGGGLAGAFGGAGTEAFGVKAGTVNKFTAWLAAAFLGLALLHAGLSTAQPVPPAKPDTSGLAGDEEPGALPPLEGASDPAKPADTKDGAAKDAPQDGDAPKKPAPGSAPKKK